MECYHHVCNKNEHNKLAQIITTYLHSRPRYDPEAAYFTSIYQKEISCLQTQCQLLQAVINYQLSEERTYNHRICRFFECRVYNVSLLVCLFCCVFCMLLLRFKIQTLYNSTQLLSHLKIPPLLLLHQKETVRGHSRMWPPMESHTLSFLSSWSLCRETKGSLFILTCWRLPTHCVLWHQCPRQ